MEQENIQTIIVDNGGDTIKAGFNLDSYPCTVFPNVSTILLAMMSRK